MAEPRDITDQMMDYLYEELSESERVAFEQELARSPGHQAQLAALQETRQAVRAVQLDQEPPAALSAILLHTAAKHAKATGRRHALAGAPASGVWSRLLAWLQPVAHHPALSAAAGLLLVAGVAGSLYVRGIDSSSHSVVEPLADNASSGRVAPASVAAGDVAKEESGAPVGTPLAEEPSAAVSDQGIRQEGKWAGDVALASEQTEFELGADKQARKQEPLKKEGRREKSKRSRSVSSDGTVANAVSGADPGVDSRGSFASPTGSNQPPRRARATGKSGGKAVEKKPAASPPPPATKRDRAQELAHEGLPGAVVPVAEDETSLDFATDKRSASDSEMASGYAMGGSGSTAERSRVAESLHGKLNRHLDSAAKKSRESNCRKAAAVANDLLDKYPEYYYQSVRGSARAKVCQWYIADETSRRSRRRARAKATSPAKPTTSKQSDNAAPPAEADTEADAEPEAIESAE